ncbi:MAG: hypothetical protein JSS32_00465 [Verrucomicrobia bacterium]|nr:hypothetical protein [Verrucomicrobiota bacterium]
MKSPSSKTNQVLRVILIAVFLILFRVWHLAVVQRDDKLLHAHRSQRKTHLVRADRGSICDRFHVPLALNRICYNASIYYSHIAQIPIATWQEDSSGTRKKIFPRKEYIEKLSALLAQELGLDSLRIEDEIHSKASLFPHAPYIVKSDLSEKEHSRLCQLEREWPGLHAEIASERFYPLGKVGADLIGTMGSINSREYGEIAQEMGRLEEAAQAFEEGRWEDLPPGYHRIEDVYRRLHELKEKAYTLNDRIGKTGAEGQFEQRLRGYFGKKSIEIDQKGRFLKDLPNSRPAVAGQQVVLSISSELQQFAESLLAHDEKVREGRSLGFDPAVKSRKALKQPWIKGGAIVALDPNTGEVLAMASYPRSDPNDFIPSGPNKEMKNRQVNRWLENERFIADLWDGKEKLWREKFQRNFTEEWTPLTWEFYLDLILPSEGPLKSFFHRCDDLKTAILLQEDFEALLYYTNLSDPKALFESLPKCSETIRARSPDAAASLKRIESHLHPIALAQDKLFALDILRLAVYSAAFSDELIRAVGSLKLSTYRAYNQAFQKCEAIAKKEAFAQFRKGPFQEWRAQYQKDFLAEKRAQEKATKTYARPYLDYLDEKERQLFAEDWAEKRFHAVASLLKSGACPEETAKFREHFLTVPAELQIEWLRTFRSYRELDRPLLFAYKKVRKPHLEKNLAAAFYPIGGFGFSRSSAFQASSPPGSIFKLVAAYAALSQNVPPFSMIDETAFDPRVPKSQVVGYTLNHVPYPRHYKGGRLPRSHIPNTGKIDLVGAIEQSSNPYFSLLAGDFLSDPEDLAKTARLFGYGERSNIDLPHEASGNNPTDLKTNRTGLYSYAIGQHTALATPLQTAVFLAALANGGRLLEPKIAKEFIGPMPDRSSLEPFEASSYFGKEELNAIGLHFPLFTAAQPRHQTNVAIEQPTRMKRQIPLAAAHRNTLFEGMDRAVWGTKGSARPGAIKALLTNPLWMRDYLALQHQMIGKTGTAEFSFNPNINPGSESHIYKHIWFGAISFVPDKLRWSHPDLVVVVYLRYGDGGKEAAPLAAQVILKWREICSRYSNLGN